MRVMATRTWMAATIGAALLLGGCGGSDGDSGGDGFTASGTVTLIGVSKAQVLAADGAGPGDKCQGAGTLGVFDEDAEVLVLDADGTKIAVGKLGAGELPEGADGLDSLGFTMCSFEFAVDDVPSQDGLLTLKVGESETTFKETDAADLKVKVAGDEYP